MASAPASRGLRFAFGAAFALASAAALAQNPATTAATDAPIVLAQATPSSPMARPPQPSTYTYPPLEAGVRRAAAEGPEALRRYIYRTRMIYNWYYPDFVMQ